jgi:hypothetical protein
MPTPVPIDATCATCRWCERGPDAEEDDLWDAYCHYNPPTDNGWPSVHLTRGFCAQWEEDLAPQMRTHPSWREVLSGYAEDPRVQQALEELGAA